MVEGFCSLSAKGAVEEYRQPSQVRGERCYRPPGAAAGTCSGWAVVYEISFECPRAVVRGNRLR